MVARPGVVRHCLAAAGALAAVLFADDGARPSRAAAQVFDPARPAAAQAAPSTPALWRAEADGAVVHAFGSLQTLPRARDWFTDELLEALQGASIVYFELHPDDLAAAAAGELTYENVQFLYQDGGGLEGAVAPDLWARLQAQADAGGPPVDRLRTMRPWFAALGLSAAGVTATGYRRDDQVERILAPLAERMGAQVRGLETVEAQLQRLSALNEAQQVAWLRNASEILDDPRRHYDALTAAWRAGDLEAVDALANAPLRVADGLYAALVSERNARWSEEIAEAARASDGPVLVVVSAGHLAGPDSLVDMLAAEGFVITRE